VITKEKWHNKHTYDLQYIRLGVNNSPEPIFSYRFSCCMGLQFCYGDWSPFVAIL
jgi:hypothetical protein